MQRFYPIPNSFAFDAPLAHRLGFGVEKNCVRSARFYVRASLHENLAWAIQDQLKEVFNLLTPEGKPNPANERETDRFD